MYIQLSADEALFNHHASQAKMNGDTIRNFVPHCFKKNLSDPSSGNVPDPFMSFDGHGLLDTYAGRTPEQFVHLLTAEKLEGQTDNPFKLPTTVQVIELMGCNIGLRPGPDTPNYAERVADLLAANPQYQHIQVRAFSHANAYTPEEGKTAKYASLYLVVEEQNRVLLFENNASHERYKTLWEERRQLEKESSHLKIVKNRLEEDVGKTKKAINDHPNVKADYEKLIKEFSFTPDGKRKRSEADKESVTRYTRELKAYEEEYQRSKPHYEDTIKQHPQKIAELTRQIQLIEQKRFEINKEITDIRNNVLCVTKGQNRREMLKEERFRALPQAEREAQKKRTAPKEEISPPQPHPTQKKPRPRSGQLPSPIPGTDEKSFTPASVKIPSLEERLAQFSGWKGEPTKDWATRLGLEKKPISPPSKSLPQQTDTSAAAKEEPETPSTSTAPKPF